MVMVLMNPVLINDEELKFVWEITVFNEILCSVDEHSLLTFKRSVFIECV